MPGKLFLLVPTPVAHGFLKSYLWKNVQVVPISPQVKSGKTRKLSYVGEAALVILTKNMDPTCYALSFNGERRCRSRSKSFSKMSVHGSVRDGDGSPPRSDASGFACTARKAVQGNLRSRNTRD